MFAPLVALGWLAATAVPALAPSPAHRPPLRVVAVGDVLIHEPLHRQALRDPEGFASLWAPVHDRIAQADLAFANLEGPVAPGVRASGVATADPGDVFDGRVYTSYPAFNYHARLVRDLVATGFDVVSTANNHAMDRGAQGEDRTLDELDAVGLAHVGSRRSTDAGLPPPVIVTRSGWRTAWVACAYGTNGIPDRHHQVALCFQDREALLAQVRTLAHDPAVDAVLVAPHVGVEYENRQRSDVVALDRALIEAGAVAVLGGHPHVTQPLERWVATDGHEGLIAYSLGNFVSGQFQRVATRAEMLLAFTLVQGADGRAHLGEVTVTPLEMTRRAGHYSVEPITSAQGTPAVWQRLARMFGLTKTTD